MLKQTFQSRYLYEALAAQTNLPSAYMDAGRVRPWLQDSIRQLRDEIVGQDEALSGLERVLVGKAVQRNMGWDAAVSSLQYQRDTRPLACILACGPTGVGKTETAHLLARTLYQGRTITLNGGDVGPEAPHGVATWVGAPPGYVGYNQGGTLTDGLRTHRACVILVDELEKASPEAVQNILLPLMGDGSVVDRSTGDTLWASECIILATSNTHLEQRRSMGFRASQGYDSGDEALEAQLGQYLLPEIIGRFNEVLSYAPLGLVEKRTIWDREMVSLLRRRGLSGEVKYDASAAEWLHSRLSSISTGARGVRDLFQEMLPSLAEDVHPPLMLTMLGGRLIWA